MYAKIFLQNLWLAKLTWDDEISGDLLDKWLTIRENLIELNSIQIDRWVGTTDSQLGLELHAFCDASLSAYGAVIYLRVIHSLDDIQVSLLVAKTRVRPLKTITLPRLELCGAVLASELIHGLQETLSMQHIPVHIWTDSSIVLSWLQEHPSKWKVFIANRVALIHDKVPNATWHYVPSAQNPADLVTRGIRSSELRACLLWWSGPPWLKLHSSNWPQFRSTPESSSLEDEVRIISSHVRRKTEDDYELLTRFSSLTKLLRLTAYCFRFVTNTRTASSNRKRGSLTAQEMATALEHWIKVIQHIFFASEISCILSKRNLPPNSKLLRLNPLLDSQHILRLGGRLKNSNLSFEEKFPIILPAESHLTSLIISFAHSTTLHGGVQLTLHYIRAKYWILRGRSKVRDYIHRCIICHRHNARTKSQLMADLPENRVTPSKPFLSSGVDYAGPVMVKSSKGRGQRSIKSYIAIFICLVTRAVHIELVLDLSAEAFIGAFRRFISRRGRCAHLFSDNATNFVAADKELTTNFHKLIEDYQVAQVLAADHTQWHFIPPAAPHFGGLWEAAVKSFKHHFRRVVGDHLLTIEEMMTLLSQIEACLNSRPLYAQTDDPEDLSALTPSHFLVGEPLITVPTPSLVSISLSRLNRWQLVQRMYEDIWNRWYKEYLHHLQLRNKWYQQQSPVRVNDLVLIKDDRLPPAKWLLGRITEVHPGPDNLIRVVTIRHKGGYFKRPISKISVLPLESKLPETELSQS